MVGYYSAERKVFYPWRDIVLPTEKVPGAGETLAHELQHPNYLNITIIKGVDPPVQYLIAEDGKTFAPGYYDYHNMTFFAWEGHVLPIAELPIPLPGESTTILRQDKFEGYLVVKIPPPAN